MQDKDTAFPHTVHLFELPIAGCTPDRCNAKAPNQLGNFPFTVASPLAPNYFGTARKRWTVEIFDPPLNSLSSLPHSITP
jgi:hypothetical protein